VKLELEHQDTYGETYFYMIYRISFSNEYHIEAQNKDMNNLTRREIQKEWRSDLTSQLLVHYVLVEPTNP
jgi:hypothetical protein